MKRGLILAILLAILIGGRLPSLIQQDKNQTILHNANVLPPEIPIDTAQQIIQRGYGEYIEIGAETWKNHRRFAFKKQFPFVVHYFNRVDTRHYYSSKTGWQKELLPPCQTNHKESDWKLIIILVLLILLIIFNRCILKKY